MTERFVHYAVEPVRAVQDCPQYGGRATRGDKPNGMWFSVDGDGDGWSEWCKGEKFGLERLKVRTQIIFHLDAKILRLSNAKAIRRFTKTYGVNPDWMRDARFGNMVYGIDWPRIAKRYDGIIIAPYVWSCRLDHSTFWYYGWDCASGVVWRARAVKALKVLRRRSNTSTIRNVKSKVEVE